MAGLDGKNVLSTVDTKGMFDALVISNTDTTGASRIMVKISALDPQRTSSEPKDSEEEFDHKASETSVDENEYTGKITRTNGRWAKPLFYSTAGFTNKQVVANKSEDGFSDHSDATSKTLYEKTKVVAGGSRIIPKVGSMVVCFFMNNDPSDLRYLLASSDGHIGVENIPDKSALDLMQSKNIAILHQTVLGDVLYFDENEASRAFMLYLKDISIRAESNETSEFFQINTPKLCFRLVDKSTDKPPSGLDSDNTKVSKSGETYAEIFTKSGHYFRINDTEDSIEARTKGGQTFLMKDPGQHISFKNAANSVIQIEGANGTVSVSGTCNISSAKLKLSGKGGVTIGGPMISLLRRA